MLGAVHGNEYLARFAGSDGERRGARSPGNPIARLVERQIRYVQRGDSAVEYLEGLGHRSGARNVVCQRRWKNPNVRRSIGNPDNQRGWILVRIVGGEIHRPRQIVEGRIGLIDGDRDCLRASGGDVVRRRRRPAQPGGLHIERNAADSKRRRAVVMNRDKLAGRSAVFQIERERSGIEPDIGNRRRSVQDREIERRFAFIRIVGTHDQLPIGRSGWSGGFIDGQRHGFAAAGRDAQRRWRTPGDPGRSRIERHGADGKRVRSVVINREGLDIVGEWGPIHILHRRLADRVNAVHHSGVRRLHQQIGRIGCVEMRNARAGLVGIRREHFDAIAARGENLRAVPPQVAADDGRQAIGVGQPQKIQRPVLQAAIENKGIGILPAAGRGTDAAEESQAVADFMQNDGVKIVLPGAGIAVGSVIKIEVGTEGRRDIGDGGIQIHARELVRLGDGVVDIAARRVGEVARDAQRSARAEHSRRQRIERGVDRHRHVAGQAIGPDLQSRFEGRLALRADGWIVEAFVRPVVVIDDERKVPAGFGDHKTGAFALRRFARRIEIDPSQAAGPFVFAHARFQAIDRRLALLGAESVGVRPPIDFERRDRASLDQIGRIVIESLGGRAAGRPRRGKIEGQGRWGDADVGNARAEDGEAIRSDVVRLVGFGHAGIIIDNHFQRVRAA
ncbi:MAG: hypothetical protein BWZ10_00949 [candidate division BRC1 bacterium ADurb.BinA364]|nr:MAG: hypothetical protein BWZ10_00949 [candidate division BRC1 bacterium ADurb.BinA364]